MIKSEYFLHRVCALISSFFISLLEDQKTHCAKFSHLIIQLWIDFDDWKFLYCPCFILLYPTYLLLLHSHCKIKNHLDPFNLHCPCHFKSLFFQIFCKYQRFLPNPFCISWILKNPYKHPHAHWY